VQKCTRNTSDCNQSSAYSAHIPPILLLLLLQHYYCYNCN